MTNKNLFMKKLHYLLVAIFSVTSFSLFAQTATTDHAFQPSEKISYTVYYNALGIYVNAGSATFTTTDEKYMNKPVYHVVGEGSTNPSMIGYLR